MSSTVLIRCCLLVAMASLALCGEAWAWGDLAHKVICEIAYRSVQPKTREEIDRLMRLDNQFPGFADACIYPDHPRIRAPEHFINLPRNSRGLASDQCPEADVCVVSAIKQDAGILASRSESDAARAVALKSLGHWVGDIHQPLHVSFKDDLGGNKISVTGQCQRNLHAVWDSCLVQYTVGPIAAEAADDLFTAISPEMRMRWTASRPRDWANESFAITEASSTQYCVASDGSCNPGAASIAITEAYLSASEPVVKEQLQKAGVRLGNLLDDLLGRQ